MSTNLELAAAIVSSHVSVTPMASDVLIEEIKKVYSALQALGPDKEAAAAEQAKPVINVKGSFKKNEVLCLVCGRGKMKTLTRHLRVAHNIKPGEYRKQFGIAASQPLTAKEYSAARKRFAEEKGLAQNLAKAREVRAEKLKVKEAPTTKAAKPLAAKKTAPTKAVKAKNVKAKAGVKPTK